MKRYITVPDGRIAYREYGEGTRTVIVFHGLMGSSLLSAEWIKAIEAAGVCCIVLERPGYGDSTPIEMERVADWTAVFAPFVEALGVEHAIAAGCSAGAVYAYASAATAPRAIEEVWILDGVPAVYMERVIRHYSAEAREAYARFLNAPRAEIQDYYAAGIENFLASPAATADSLLRNTLTDAGANRCFGPAQESRLQITPWGFDPARIAQRVTLWHAEGDTMVPYRGAEEMVDILRNTTLLTADPARFDEAASGMEIHMQSISHGFRQLLETVDP